MRRLAAGLLILCALLCGAAARAQAGLEGRVVTAGADGTRGLPGAAVRLFLGSGLLATAQTAADGTYRLLAAASGECRLQVVLPEGTLFGKDGFVKEMSAGGREGWSEPFRLSDGQNLRLRDVEAVPAASVSGRAFEDANGNGLPDAGEGPLAGVVAVLLRMEGEPEVAASAAVDRDGCYAFTRLRGGRYALAFTLPDGVLFTAHSDEPGGSCAAGRESGTALSRTFDLAEGEARAEMNAGGYSPGRIGDFVWRDGNGNGLQDYGEPPCAGVRLTLLDGKDGVLSETESDEYGFYRFGGLRPGAYRVRIEPPGGLRLTAPGGGELGEIDSDADPDTGLTPPVRLTPGGILRNVDFGLTEEGRDR